MPEDLIQKLKNPDGTISRPPEMFPTVPPSTTDPSSFSLSKDVAVNSDKPTSVRLYLPREWSLQENNNISNKKLKVIVYVHGGGFVFATAAYTNFHDFCSYAASHLSALVVSVDYRLAPEHRLPAAYEDTLEALRWVKDAKDEWISEFGDLANCVMMGDSAGANILYQVGLRVAAQADDFKPLLINGMVLIQPFFGGLDRTRSELRLVNDPTLPIRGIDMCWDLSLPIGANQGHEYCDPFKDGGSELLDRVRDLGWRVMVVSCDGDPLYDRSVRFVKLMEGRGLDVKSMFCEGGEHGMFVGHPSKYKANQVLEFVKHIFSS